MSVRKTYEVDYLGTKNCKTCQRELSVLNFYIDTRHPGGRRANCQDCTRDKRVTYPDFRVSGEKECRTCHTVKSVRAFSRDSSNKDGLSNKCGECVRTSRTENKLRDSLKRHNLTVPQYKNMLMAQEYSCAICETPQEDEWRALSVDHDHTCCPGQKSCGKCVRGLLCSKCNLGIGYFDDNAVKLSKAAKYLQPTWADPW